MVTCGEFSFEYTTLSVTPINLTDRGWDQIHSICLMWHFIKVHINGTPSSMMKPICNIDLSHASPDYQTQSAEQIP